MIFQSSPTFEFGFGVRDDHKSLDLVLVHLARPRRLVVNARPVEQDQDKNEFLWLDSIIESPLIHYSLINEVNKVN